MLCEEYQGVSRQATANSPFTSPILIPKRILLDYWRFSQSFMKLSIHLKMKCQVNLINFVKVYISNILYDNLIPGCVYLKSHSRTSNPQINSSEQHCLPHYFSLKVKGRSFLRDKETITTWNILMKIYQHLHEHTFMLQHSLIFYLRNNVEYKLF